jgi:hypothetical protein
MINKIYCFNTENETLFKKCYKNTILDLKDIYEEVLRNSNVNFFEINKSTIVYKRYESFYCCFEVEDENEIYILCLIDFLMNALERLLGSTSEKAFIYNFKDVNYLLDNFILNGKVINLDSLDLSTSTYLCE